MPTQRPPRLDSPLVPKIIKLMSRAHVWVYKRSGGRIGGTWRVGAAFRKPAPNLLLEHRGRKSGKLFTTPLVYLEDGANLVVVASQGGLPNNPQWYHNLVADPDAAVQIGTERRLVRAHVADDAERARLWPMLVDLYADFDSYQSWTDRKIPVVVLEPR
ncbi:nitroreductase family deazaflavin-dependent oxidoreductase [Nocardia cyriacigeorgica]|uniref:Nitroreductase family deazaflavin-dependent oxidoreductase n=2 Tax=Nocardia cyriacigeorgica TaxID=135487 RepID=A0A5R8PGR0_9NOCA|nr:nitroreductase family deazaflavin-dependent oxidoreductase [Nocardia cyriacigeorgica]TLF75905.1 nitroreductase family deazaflavin-dependent oxidoreductase [Nocardia cyriacigeorgica]TLG14297.1 nitroreductase family deazaflavin-dependent oxidoreductase [Nocardia cyriacigeorgica]